MPGGTEAPTAPNSKRSSVLSTASSSSRNSVLLEFSPFKFGRKKKPPPRQNPNLRMNLILPDVLEISAANNLSTPPAGEDSNPMEDEETRERVRLREEAAQALGLSTVGHQNHSDHHSESGHSFTSNGTLREEERTGNTLDRVDGDLPSPDDTHYYHPSPLTSTTSLHPPLSPAPTHGRHRSGSMPSAIAYYPSALPPSNFNHPPLPQVTPVPCFPSTPRALATFMQTTSSGTLPKYYPSSSLRIFAMGKQWKSRHLILTSPTNVPTYGSNPLPLTFVSGNNTSHVHVSYLHLFKSPSPDERELERLEINEDSVVFISEEEIGGRKGVIQVAGIDLGFVTEIKREKTSKKDNFKEKEQVKGREQMMWLFYIADPLEKQRWIESIKNKVLGQRTIRAGLGSTLPFSNLNEPRGDMDVMMSLRAQASINPPPHATSPTRSTFSAQESGNGYVTSPASPTTPTAGSHSVSGHDAASVSSARSSKKARPSSSHGKNSNTPGIGSGAVLSLKGLFGSKASTSGRQRSSSRASGIDEWDDPSTSRGAGVERTESVVNASSPKSSIVPKGHSLISILRASSPPNEANNVGFISSSPGMGIHAPAVDFAALGIPNPTQSPQSQLDRKILQTPLAHVDHDGLMTARPLLFSNDLSDTASGIAACLPDARGNRIPSRTFSVGGTFSLQPAPRKRWTSTSDVHTPPVINTPSSQHLQLQESPLIKDRLDLDDFDVLGGAPSISRINTSGNGSLTPEPMPNSSPATKRTSGQSAFSFSFGTPPGSGNLDVEYRPRSVSSRSARSGRSGRSVDTREDELDELDVPVSGFDGHSSSNRTRRTSDGSSGFGTFPDVDKRSSMSSGKRNSVGVVQGKRWSRQLPKRLTPPSGPPPAAPNTPPGSPAQSVSKGKSLSPVKSLSKAPPSHPYSGAATERRASIMTTRSTRSTSSRPSSSHSSVVSSLPSFSKRASTSSAMSALSTTSLQASGTVTPVSSGVQIVGNGVTSHSRPPSYRSSMAPPPRPAPTFALPPAPGESSASPMLTPPVSAPVSSTNNKPSFRDSITSRAFRLSLMAPKPPPSSVLPPRPDELQLPKSPTSSITSRNTHRRSHSGNNSPLSSSLYSIPGSPIPPSVIDAVPAARGPLPPTPVSVALISTPSRGVSIKQRLRILSAPSPASAPPSPRSAARPMTIMAPLTIPSPPGTPTFANGLTHYFENSGSFHAVAIPTTPSLPAPKIHHVEDEPDAEPELTSLSPPPRRSSKRISIPEVEISSTIQEIPPTSIERTSIEDTNSNDANKPFSLSRPASVISFGVVNV
ncbi:hypothetical protein J3R30DRAFT_3458062 [Lentinula aciculospora]|uniref:PH domain-containing protein n=1 Tax=Lentinula aciculospora TaxID=153920 RepID=A0A9W9AHX2_9AGAR|nr:hypothetical protein J3R30DRAFT_3458062 [Lentinula aciculospora]